MNQKRLDMRSELRPTTRPEQCELCQRAVPLTQHHLIPKRLHRNEKLRRQYGLDGLRQRIAWLCLACHKHVHRCFGERELANSFSTVEALSADPEIVRFVGWLKDKPDDFRPRLSRRRRDH